MFSTIAAGVAVDYLVGKAIDMLGSKFKSSVIERWSRQRADEFVRTFCTLVAEDNDEASIQKYLNAILDDEQKSESLFDAYRRVALSASRTLGPRIIAIVTAKVVGENRQPTAVEDQILMVTERLSDAELEEVEEYFSRSVVEYPKCEDGSYLAEGMAEDSAWVRAWDIGPAFAKLEAAGFLAFEIALSKPEALFVDTDELPLSKLKTSIRYRPAYEGLVNVIARAKSLSKSVAP